jgi:hypothetical protein
MSIHASDNCNNARLPSLSADRADATAIDKLQVQTDLERQIQAGQVTEVILQQQIQRQRLMMEMAQRMRQSLNITRIMGIVDRPSLYRASTVAIARHRSTPSVGSAARDCHAASEVVGADAIGIERSKASRS